jgi:hypothetical protein
MHSLVSYFWGLMDQKHFLTFIFLFDFGMMVMLTTFINIVVEWNWNCEKWEKFNRKSGKW